MKNIAEISGVVERGLRHSSGYNEEGEAFRFYDGIIGSIRSQRPFFEEIIPNFSEIHDGSINISIRPKRFDILTFDYEITCRWDPNRPSETFRFVGVDLSHEGKLYSGMFIILAFQNGKNVQKTILLRFSLHLFRI